MKRPARSEEADRSGFDVDWGDGAQLPLAIPTSRRFLAVPFVGKDAPSPSSEYAHPDIAIGLTIYAYRYEGLRKADFGATLAHLRADFETEHGPELQRPSGQQWR